MKNRYYDPKMNSDVLTTEQAAEYLGYTYEYMRQLVSDGDIESHDNAGKTLLFLKSKLEFYKIKKSATREVENKINGIPEKSEAIVHIHAGAGVSSVLFEEIDNFTWDEIPRIQARIANKYHKNLSFTINVSSPEGGKWEIEYQAPDWIPELLVKAFKKIFRKKEK